MEINKRQSGPKFNFIHYSYRKHLKRGIFDGLSTTHRNENGSSAAYSKKKKKRRSQDDVYKRKLSRSDEPFDLSRRELVEIINIVRARRVPTRKALIRFRWDKHAISFHRKMSYLFWS